MKALTNPSPNPNSNPHPHPNFEDSDRTEPAKQWTKYFEAFDWTLQDARGANNPAQLRQMQAQYGLYCIAPKVLEQVS